MKKTRQIQVAKWKATTLFPFCRIPSLDLLEEKSKNVSFVKRDHIRRTSPAPYPGTILYKVKKHNIDAETGDLSEDQNGELLRDGLLNIASHFYGERGLLWSLKTSELLGLEGEAALIDNRHFANGLLYVNNPLGYEKQPKYEFSEGAFISKPYGDGNQIITEEWRDAAVWFKEIPTDPGSDEYIEFHNGTVDAIHEELEGHQWADTQLTLDAEIWVPPPDYLLSLSKVLPPAVDDGNILFSDSRVFLVGFQ